MNTPPLRILWSARFEHDKGGEGLYKLLQVMDGLDVNYQLAMTGQQFRRSPAVFKRIQAEFSHRLAQFGYVETAGEYASLLNEADIVLSTAMHEFQGLAVMQGVAAGCVPVVPDRLAYTELYDEQYRYPSCPDDPGLEAQGAAELIVGMASQLPATPDVSGFGVAVLKHRYQHVLSRLRDSQPLPS